MTTLLDEILALEQGRSDALNHHDIDAVRQSQREDLHVVACGAQAAVVTGHVVNTSTRPGQTSTEQSRLKLFGLKAFSAIMSCFTASIGLGTAIGGFLGSIVAEELAGMTRWHRTQPCRF